ncbi:MAG: dipeptide epimerase [Bacteroidia bacterium]|jgi:L-alanine-DL-glutamate epimerase-like enolase superfamily enzyme|nr:dipeptide epimerase [Bacteroidia bacterium]
MLDWRLKHQDLQLKYTWKLSRNATDVKRNQIITVTDGAYTAYGEVAPNIRYDETPEGIEHGFQLFLQNGGKAVTTLDELTALLQHLPLKKALRYGIESAFIHFACAQKQQTLAQFLNIAPCTEQATAYSLPIMPVSDIPIFYQKHELGRFKKLKLKVNAAQAHELLDALATISNHPIMLDGNEAWTDADELLRFLDTLAAYPIDMIEQPMPAGSSTHAYVKQRSRYPIIADESVCDTADFDLISEQFHGINMKLMKAGGLMNGLSLLKQARAHGLYTMVGCMIETSLGISDALQLSAGANWVDLDGFMVIANEPFGLVQEQNGTLSLA